MTETPTPQAPAPQPTPPQKKGKGKWVALGCGGCGGIILIIIVIAIIASIAGGGSSDDSKSKPAASQEQTTEADDSKSGDDSKSDDKKSEDGKHTMTYEIRTDGPKADVTYMKKGMQISQKSGVESGWTADVKYDDELDMIGANINAQLDGSGKVSCTIKVDGEVVAENDSEGDYVVVDCTAPTDF